MSIPEPETALIDPADAVLMQLVARFNAGQIDAVIQQANDLLKTFHGSVKLRNLLAVCYSGTGRFDRSLQAPRQVLILKPNNMNAQVHRGKAALSSGMTTESLKATEAAICLSAGSEEAHFDRAVAQKNAGEPERAVTSLKRASLLGPQNTGPYLERSQALLGNSQFGDSVRETDRARVTAPLTSVIYSALAASEMMLGKHQSALDNARRGAVLQPDHPGVYHTVGNLFQETLDLQRAFRAYRITVLMNPNDNRAWQNLAHCLRSFSVAHIRCGDLRPFGCVLGR